jgi:hypothetical protein
MGKTLSKTLCLLAAALLLIPSANAVDWATKTKTSKLAERSEVMKTVAAQNPKLSTGFKPIPRKTAETAASSKIFQAKQGTLRAPAARNLSTTSRFAGSPITMIGIDCYSAGSNEAGVYEILTTGSMSYLNSAITSGYSAVIDGSYYRVCDLLSFFGYYFPYVASFDMDNDWEGGEEYLDDFSMIAMCMATDPTSGQIYGLFYDASGASFEFGVADFNSLTRTTICTEDGTWAAFGFDGNGQAYAVDTNGTLLKVDKETGATTEVGPTGYAPYYLGGSAVDTRANVMYWYVYDAEGAGSLVSIDLATGQTSYVCDATDDQIVGLVMPVQPEEGAPAAVENLSITFPKGSLSGTAKFDIPAVNFGGEASVGDVKYQILANGEVVASGTSAFGASVETAISVPESGNYSFVVILSNEVGDGPKTKVSMFVGNDTPIAPEVTIAYSDGKFNVSWTPITEGINGGYMDLDQLTYQVVRYPGEVIVAEATTDTSLVDAVPYPDNLTTYYYTVQAMWGDMTSDYGTSNKVTLGNIVPPYFEAFDNADSILPYSIIDANNDGQTWKYNSNLTCLSVTYNGFLDMDDWLMSPAVKLEAGKAYKITIDASCYNTRYPERVALYVGSEPTVEAMTTTLAEPTLLDQDGFVTLGDYFVAETTGSYYVGIHGCSDADQFYLLVKNLSIEAGISAAAPGAVTDATITPGAYGALNAQISFTAPAIDFSGKELSSLTKIEVLRGDEVVKTFESPAVGAACSFQDEVAEDGDYTYTILPYNEDGAGKSVSLAAYIGTDYPGEISNVKLIEESDGSVTITWDPLTTDVNGNPIDASMFTYQVRDLTASGYPVIEAEISSTDFNFEPVEEGEQAFVQYGVSAVTKRGEGSISVSPYIPVGTPYETPYFESFADQTLTYNLATQSTDYASWSLGSDDSLGISAYDGDNGYAYCKASAQEAEASLLTGKIDVALDNPRLTFASYYIDGAQPDPNTVTVDVRVAGEEQWTTLFDKSLFDIAGGEGSPASGWYKAYVDLNQYKGKVIQLRFKATAYYYSYTMIDAISIENVPEYNLVAKSLNAPSYAKPNEEFNVSLVVANDGSKDAASYSVEFFRNDESLGVVDGGSLASGETATVSMPQTFSVVSDPESVYNAVIDFANDANPIDNESAFVTVKLQLPNYNGPKDLAGEVNDDQSVTISWSAPALQVDGTFDDFEDGVEGSDTYGDWTFVDGDGDIVGSVSNVSIPGIETNGTASFVVFNGSACGLGSDLAHSGDKSLLSMYTGNTVDDWAITPELRGIEQTVSFWARSYSSGYPETIELLYSTTDKETSSFIHIETYEAIPNTWTEYKATLPEGAKYFAIRSCATDAFFLVIDDVSYVSATDSGEPSPVLGYNVYRDGVKLNSELLTDTSFVDNPGVGEFNYYVSAVYAEGESAASGPVNVDTTSVGMTLSKLNVSAENRVIIITNAATARVEVTSLDGKLLYVGKGDAKVPVNSGVYMVKVGKAVTKLMVK